MNIDDFQKLDPFQKEIVLFMEKTETHMRSIAESLDKLRAGL